mgnify:CR=1 FL=1
MGIGNELKGDDSVGPYIAKKIDHPRWLAINCVTVPGNFTSVVKKHKPKILVMVDAAKMGLKPGQFRRLPKKSIDRMFASTHTVPISATINYLENYADKIIFIGIEAKNLEHSTELSPEVKEGADELIRTLLDGDISAIKKTDS